MNVLILLVVVIILYFYFFRNVVEKYVDIELEGEEVDSIPLDDDESIEKSVDNFMRNYDVFPNSDFDFEKLVRDGIRYEIFGYTLTSCRSSKVSVLPYYVVQSKPEAMKPTQVRFVVPGYTLVYKHPINEEPCYDEFELVDNWENGKDIIDQSRKRKFVFMKVGEPCVSVPVIGPDDAKDMVCGRKIVTGLYSFNGYWKKLAQVVNHQDLMIEIGKSENVDESSIGYKSIRLQTENSYEGGTLFVIDVMHIPNSQYSCSKILLGNEFNLLETIDGVCKSSLYTPNDGECMQSLRKCFVNPTECDFVLGGHTVKEINLGGGGLFVCYWEKGYGVKVWFVPYGSQLYKKIKSEKIRTNELGTPYTIVKPCKNSLRDGMKLTIQSELCKIAPADVDMSTLIWMFRGIQVYKGKK